MKALLSLLQLIVATTLTMGCLLGVIMVAIEHNLGTAVACAAILAAPMIILWVDVYERLFPYNEYE